MRVASLLPSATEILCAIEGGSELLVGRSHECDFPAPPQHAGLQRLPVLTSQKTHATTSADIDRQVREALHKDGGDGADAGAASASLYSLDGDLLRKLRPDVILTQDLCEVCSIDLNAVRAIARELNPQPAIISLNPASLEDVFDDVLRVGEAVGLGPAARETVVALRERYWSARDFVNPYIEGAEVAFLEWMDPLFCAGHWTPQLIETAGGRHSLNRAGEKSRRIAIEELVEVMPQRLIICPCGYTIEHTQRELDTLTSQRWWRTLPAVQDGEVVIVDGSAMFNRPGPRLVEAYCWLVSWLNARPEVMPPAFPWVRVA
jgi:ABC-type Fe3+-hydroxamate transport system substrate-binding protein